MTLHRLFSIGAKVVAVAGLAATGLAVASDEVQLGPLSRIGAFKPRGQLYLGVCAVGDIIRRPSVGVFLSDESWPYARVFTASGKQYVLMRYVGDLKSNGMTVTTDGKADTRMPLGDVDVVRTVDPKDGLVFSSATAGSPGDGKGFELRLSPNSVHWTENGVADLHGTGSPLGRVGSGAFMPFVKKDGSTDIEIYTGPVSAGDGAPSSVSRSRGMFGFDQSIGKEKFHDTSLSRYEAIWIKWANVFENGAIEMADCYLRAERHAGLFGVGRNQGHCPFGLLRMKLSFDAQGILTKGVWTIDNEKWEMIPDNTGNTLAVSATGGAVGTRIVRRWGAVHRIGDARKAVNQFSVFEYNPRMVLAEHIEAGSPK